MIILKIIGIFICLFLLLELLMPVIFTVYVLVTYPFRSDAEKKEIRTMLPYMILILALIALGVFIGW